MECRLAHNRDPDHQAGGFSPPVQTQMLEEKLALRKQTMGKKKQAN